MASRRGRGEGSVEQMPDGRFRAILSLGVDPVSGKRVRRKFYGTTKKEALGKLREAQAAVATGQYTEPSSLKLSEWLEKWLSLRKPNVEPKTYEGWQSLVARHLKPNLGTLALGKISPLHIETLYAKLSEKGTSKSEQRKAGSVLTMALKHAVRLRLLHSNPASAVPKPKAERREFTAYDAGQARSFLAAAESDRLYALYVTALDSACRPGELFAVTWLDYSAESRTLSITQSLEEIKGKLRVKDTKTPKSRRTLILSEFTVQVLAAHRERMRREKHDVTDGLLFPATDGSYLRGQNVMRRSLRPIQKRAKVPAVRLYDLRHTAATLLLAAGVNIKVVSERLGHASIQITLDHYAHVLPGMQGVAAGAFDAMMRLSPNSPPGPQKPYGACDSQTQSE